MKTECTVSIPLGQLPDEEIIILCQQRHPRAFQELVKRYQRTVYGLIYNLAPDWTDIADLSQEVFIRVWRGIQALHRPKAFRSWLSQVVTNLFYDELRKRPRRVATVSLDQSFDEDDVDNAARDIPDDSAGPEDYYRRQELANVVRKAITALPLQFRRALVLREVEGLSYDEIAGEMNSDIGTVKSRIARARKKVQRRLQPYLNADLLAPATAAGSSNKIRVVEFNFRALA